MSSFFPDTHNVVAILEKSDAAEGFEQIIDFLNGSYIHYAFIVNPHIYVSCIKQFWNTASVKRSNDVTRLQALVDRKKIVISEDETVSEDVAEDVANEAIPSSPTPLILPSPPSHDILSTTQEKANKVKSSKLRRLKKVGTIQRVVSSDDMEDVFNQGRMIDDLDEDEGIELVVGQVKDANIAKTEGRHAAEQAKKQAEIYHLDLDHPSKVLSVQEDDSEVQEVVEVVTTAKLITEVVTAATSQVSAVSATISTAKPMIPAAAPTGKGILIETLKLIKKKDQIELDAEYARKLHEEISKDHEEINKDIDWDAAINHVKKKSKENPQYIKRYQVMKKRPQTESEARKNMMIYLKNTAGYKLDFFKGMSYDEICLKFQATFDANMRFLFKSREEMEEEDQEVLKSINETPAHKAAKRRKLNEEAQEVKDLKKHLEVINDEDDDVFIEATQLARKVPVVDYQTVVINNKPRFKIIKADETHQLYISFITLLKNFDREDLENL
nr:hypothetical protein [Tanacetum cinerariifolium]